jgi:flagella basal body P-ring formation protein FlgA
MFASVIFLAALSANAEGPQSCKVLLRSIAAGEPLFSDDVAPGQCPDSLASDQIRYDLRRHLVVARSEMSPGTQLGLVYLPLRPAVLAGEAVRIEVAVGHVSISRTATALESARYGQRFHVRTTDGLVLQAPALRDEPMPEWQRQ